MPSSASPALRRIRTRCGIHQCQARQRGRAFRLRLVRRRLADPRMFEVRVAAHRDRRPRRSGCHQGPHLHWQDPLHQAERRRRRRAVAQHHDHLLARRRREAALPRHQLLRRPGLHGPEGPRSVQREGSGRRLGVHLDRHHHRAHGRNTKPEILISKALFAECFRYRLNARNLPGRPDLVFPRYRAVTFVHGCFWHGHGCHLFTWPRTNSDFWRAKIEGNISRDAGVRAALLSCGWRILTVWECALRGPYRRNVHDLVDHCARWLKSDNAEETLVSEGSTKKPWGYTVRRSSV